MKRRARRVLPFAVVVALATAAPFVLSEFATSLLAEILIWSILAMGLDLLFGYTGMLSFGQALYFGVGAYGITLGVTRLGWAFLPSLLLAVIAAGVAAGIAGFFAVRLTWHYFAIITIIFSLVLYFVALSRADLTGGEDGMSFEVPPIVDFGGVELSVYEPLVEYYFVLIVTVISFLLLRLITRSQLGLVFRALRDNTNRASLLGYDTLRYRWVSFVIAGMFGGLSGALLAVKMRYASASYLFWTVSGDAVIWTVVGGAGTLVGPIVGTATLITLRDYLSTWFENHQLFTGLIAIVVVLTAPQGIVGLARRLTTRS